MSDHRDLRSVWAAGAAGRERSATKHELDRGGGLCGSPANNAGDGPRILSVDWEAGVPGTLVMIEEPERR